MSANLGYLNSQRDSLRQQQEVRDLEKSGVSQAQSIDKIYGPGYAEQQQNGAKGKSFGSLLELALPALAGVALPVLAPGLAAGIGGLEGADAASLISPAVAGGATLGAGEGALQGGLESKNPITGALEGAGEGALSGAAGGLTGAAGSAAGGGGLGALAGGATNAGIGSGLSVLSGGRPSLLGALTSGISGAAGGYGSGSGESGAAGGDINPVSGATQGVNNVAGVADNNVSGTFGDTYVPGNTDNISGNGGTNNVGGLTNGLSNVSGVSGGTNNISGGTSSGLTKNLLSDASGVSQLGNAIEGFFGNNASAQNTGGNSEVVGTNVINTPVTSEQAAAIKQTGSFTDRQLYDAMQAILQRYQRSGQGDSPQAQAEIQQLLTQQVG